MEKHTTESDREEAENLGILPELWATLTIASLPFTIYFVVRVCRAN